MVTVGAQPQGKSSVPRQRRTVGRLLCGSKEQDAKTKGKVLRLKRSGKVAK